MCVVKKTPKPSLMVVYYAKLTEIFWTSGSHLYHAYAWLKLFLLQKNFNKNLSQKDLQTIASSVVLAALSVPPYDHTCGTSHLELENEKERNMRMANLINFNLDPKPESREVVSKGVMSCVLPEVKDLYHTLEHEFLLLDLALRVQPLLIKISKLGGKLASASTVPEVQLLKCVLALEKLATLRLLQQTSRVYQTMTIKGLSQMIPFFDFSFVEKISVDAVKHKFLTMKVDHINDAVSFNIVDLESDGLRNHLTLFTESLNKARSMIYPAFSKASKIGDILPGLAEEREEELKKLKLQKITEEAEQRRLASEYEQRKHQRILREMEERELEEAKLSFMRSLAKSKRNRF